MGNHQQISTMSLATQMPGDQAPTIEHTSRGGAANGTARRAGNADALGSTGLEAGTRRTQMGSSSLERGHPCLLLLSRERAVSRADVKCALRVYFFFLSKGLRGERRLRRIGTPGISNVSRRPLIR